MPRSTALLALVLATAGLACPSLDALECQGSACTDAGSDARLPAADGGRDGPGLDAESRIRCADGGVGCAPTSEECCVQRLGSSCVTRIANSCAMGTDIFCDDPAQCSDGPCWICLDKSGDLLGASCAKADIASWGCAKSGALPLCRASGECEGGASCEPLGVVGFEPDWFSACQ